MFASILSFWQRNPALFYGLVLLFGCLFALQTPWALLPWLLLLNKKHCVAAVALFLFPSLLIYQFYTFPPSDTEVEGLFTIKSVRASERFQGGWSYSGILKTTEGRLVCRCFSKERHNADETYHLRGKVRALRGRTYTLKVVGPWEPMAHRLSLADLRYQAQSSVKGYIERHIPQPRAAHFLIGMVTGQLEDRVMQTEFSQLGLSHLMAISGLHFALIALALHMILRLFLPPKAEAVCLICGLTLYFLFIGNTPSVVRAWIMSMVFLSGQLLERRSSATNSLGVALCISLLWNPLSALSLSFQLSFLATAGILFFYAPCDYLLQMWLPKKRLKEVLLKNGAWRHGYIALSFLREGLALTAAVHITLLPLLLSYFHTFPLSSLIYNLFFPFLASLALLFFLVSLCLGHWAHVLNGYYCDAILRITASPPIHLTPVDVPGIPAWALAGVLTAVLALAVGVKIQKRADGFRIADDPLFNHL